MELSSQTFFKNKNLTIHFANIDEYGPDNVVTKINSDPSDPHSTPHLTFFLTHIEFINFCNSAISAKEKFLREVKNAK